MSKLYLAAMLAFLLSSGPALAHKIIGSGWTDGGDIEGEIGFSNGDMASKGTVVEVYDDKDNKIGEATVGDDGLFRFTPTRAIAHTFVANMGAGHVARFTMNVDELPEIGASSPKGSMASTTAPTSTPPLNTSATYDATALQAMIAKAVRKEVQPLRKEIASYKEKNNLQSILGGVGYIFGLFGVVFYLMARRKEKATT